MLTRARIVAVVALQQILICAIFSFSALAGPIHDAAKAGDAAQVEALIVAGTDVDETDIAFKTALHWAADLGHVKVVETLIEKSADVNLQELSDKTALHFASLENHAAIVERLIAAGAEVNVKDTEGATALDVATFRKVDAGIIEMLKGAGAVCGTNHHYSKWCKEAE
jgi:ankyrin repeat protein